jgi:hypothetical protein
MPQFRCPYGQTPTLPFLDFRDFWGIAAIFGIFGISARRDFRKSVSPSAYTRPIPLTLTPSQTHNLF